MSDNQLAEIITVGDLIDYLQKFPRIAVVLKSDMLAVGYNRFKYQPNPIFEVIPSPNDESGCEFMDADRIMEIGPVMLAVVL